MKYNDNGEYKDIYVKAFDTLPVGTEVDYDGSVVPSGWTEVQNNFLSNSATVSSLASTGATNISDCSITAPKDGLALVIINGVFPSANAGYSYINLGTITGEGMTLNGLQVPNAGASGARLNVTGIINIKEGYVIAPRMEQTSGSTMSNVKCAIYLYYL